MPLSYSTRFLKLITIESLMILVISAIFLKGLI